MTFKAVQTYSNGEVVRWIGPPDSEEPAPQVKLTAAEAEGGARRRARRGGSRRAAAASEDDDSNTLSIIALIVGIAGLAAGPRRPLPAPREPGRSHVAPEESLLGVLVWPPSAGGRE